SEPTEKETVMSGKRRARRSRRLLISVPAALEASRALSMRCLLRARNAAGGGEPRQQILARFNPFHRGVDRSEALCRSSCRKEPGHTGPAFDWAPRTS